MAVAAQGIYALAVPKSYHDLQYDKVGGWVGACHLLCTHHVATPAVRCSLLKWAILFAAAVAWPGMGGVWFTPQLWVYTFLL